ncbi:hypothetical protein [Streptomyces hainanensis]|uniref:Uncharacterized protein n=1 Tax=Streptomyces hainanensis TaxID=402648 RepID=A0A4R4SYX7_9ACTN|nr:hypothetical protein [Streptomyces hainanensis]TDC69598.1 hypothetical protein E1283_25780 [Streptomyces hainanensis]
MADDETSETAESPETPQAPADEPRRRRWPAVTAVAAAVTLIAGGVFGAQSLWGDGSSAPETQPAGSGGGAADGALPLDDSAGLPWGSYAALVPAGELPEAPERASIYRYQDGAVTEEAAAGLAETLGVDGELRESSGDTWTAAGPDAELPPLTVLRQAPGFWSYGGSVSAAEPAPTESAEPIGADEALRAAEPLLTALGLDADTARLTADQVAGSTRTVQAVPLVDGLPTVGLETELHYDADGSLLMAYGALALPEPAEERTTIGAQQALDAYNTDPDRPVIAPAEPQCVGTGSGPAEPMPPADGEPLECGPVTETDKPENAEATAELGLVLHQSEGSPVLVPSWLFTTDGVLATSWPAVDHRVEPAAGSGETGETGEGSPGESGEQPADPGPIDETGMTVESYAPDDESLTITFWAGVCDEYTLVADESDDTVRVTVEATSPAPDGECIALAEQQTGELALTAPIADRTLLDEAGQELSTTD